GTNSIMASLRLLSDPPLSLHAAGRRRLHSQRVILRTTAAESPPRRLTCSGTPETPLGGPDMGIRSTVGSVLESVVGRDRTNRIRLAERRGRNGLAKWLAMEEPKKPATKKQTPKKQAEKPSTTPAAGKPRPAVKPAGWQPPDPFVPHPEPRMTRHELLEGLHKKTRPRTYLEIGIRTGRSMVLSRCRSIGVDPLFKIDNPIHCDVQLIKATSDDFFAGGEPLAHFDGVPVDLAFIDGMHLSAFALRDFINIEPFMADTGVIVLDDVLPRNGLEAARDRKTEQW